MRKTAQITEIHQLRTMKVDGLRRIVLQARSKLEDAKKVSDDAKADFERIFEQTQGTFDDLFRAAVDHKDFQQRLAAVNHRLEDNKKKRFDAQSWIHTTDAAVQDAQTTLENAVTSLGRAQAQLNKIDEYVKKTSTQIAAQIDDMQDDDTLESIAPKTGGRNQWA